MPWALLLTCVLFQSAAAQDSASPKSNEEVAHALCEKWECQRQDLSVVEIFYRSVRSKVPRKHTITRKEVRELLGKLVKDRDTTTFNAVAAALDPKRKGMNPAWAEGILFLDGQSFLLDVTYPWSADLPFTVMRHGGYEVHARFLNKDRRQVDVMWEQTILKYGPTGIRDFVMLPPSNFVNEAQFEPFKDDVSRTVISKKGAVFVVGSETGFVHELWRGDYGKGRFREIVQLEPQEHSKTIVMPRVYFEGKYAGDQLASFSLKVIDKLRLDPQEPKLDFRVSVKPGDNLIDHTGEEREMIDVSEAAADVLTLIHDPGQRRRPLRGRR